MLRRLGVLAVAFIALVAISGAGLFIKGREAFYAPGPLTSPVIVQVPNGAGVSRIAQILAKQNVISDTRIFRIGVRLLGKDKALRAGEYEFPAGVSQNGAADILITGTAIQYGLTIPEGWTVLQAINTIAGTGGLTGITSYHYGEGSLLPETYAYTRGATRQSILDRMADAMDKTLKKAWANRAPDLPLKTPQDALILASIVERETGINSERARVAGVFINRLRIGMRLQSDPTVIYGLSDGMGTLSRGLTRKDLATEHPYNTYVIKGLPPEPICLPGKSAIEAVLNPAQTKELYFVADGTGGHVFSKSLREHNANVQRWRSIERAAKRAAAQQ